jgi:amidase
MSTFILRAEATGSGPTVAIKDIIDVQGLPTTAGSRAVERHARPAPSDAPLLAGLRRADARVVGKVNLHELAMLPLGTNPWFGTPVNPLDPTRIPGGSSSGSAVAVASGDAEIALGSDTGGSIRVPSACCGTAGLKTTHGRIPLEGVWPLAPSFDTIGPMARDVAGLELGMALLEPGFMRADRPATVVGRVRTHGEPAIESAIDQVLGAAEFEVVEIEIPRWDEISAHWTTVYFRETWESDHELVESSPHDVGEDIRRMVGLAEKFMGTHEEARAVIAQWRDEFLALFDRVQLLALPTLPLTVPRLDEWGDDATTTVIALTQHMTFVNAAGVPATAQPVPMKGSHLPASCQLVGPPASEDLLVATAKIVEAAAES